MEKKDMALIGVAIIICVIICVLSPYIASGDPDGLEKSAEDSGLAEDFSVDVNGEKGTYDTTISIDPPTQIDLNVEPTRTLSVSIDRGKETVAKDYEDLINKPRIESVTLRGNKDFEDLGLIPMDLDDLLDVLI